MEIPVYTTLRAARLGSDSLCHGTFGNLDFLMSATRQLERPEFLESATDWLRKALLEVGNTGFRFETHQESLNFMTGLAGCGYAMLRLAAPDQTPSVLLLKGTDGRPSRTGTERLYSY